MQEDKLIRLLLKCRQSRDPSEARRLLTLMRQQDREMHPVVGNHLVPMLVDCGMLSDAQFIFDCLPHHTRNQYSWTAIITAHVDGGNHQLALHFYHLMHTSPLPVSPTIGIYLALLNACAKVKDRETGQEFHTQIIYRGYETDPITYSAAVGNTLVGLYGKCGLFAEARHTFYHLAVHDVISWNALITGYAGHGLAEEAKECLNQMQLDSIPPDNVTFICCVKACGVVRALSMGRQLHIEILKRAFERDVFEGNAIVGNILVDMYTKCGSFVEAHCVFGALADHSEVSWNALMSGFTEKGCDKEVLECFDQMQCMSVPADPITFVCCLKACATLGYMEMGHKLHSEIFKKGFENDLCTGSAVLGNTLVDMYSKCGAALEALYAFQCLPVRSVASWNTLLTAFAEKGHSEDVERCFQQMQEEGISPSVITFVCSLKACGKAQALETGRRIHVDVIIMGLEQEVNLGNTIVDFYSKCALVAEAQKVFDRLSVKTAVSWNALMAGYFEQALDDEVLICFKRMQVVDACQSHITYICCLKSCGSIGAVKIGREIHGEVRKQGLESNILVGSALIDMYSKCGLVVEGQEVFDKLPVRDVVVWTAMIKAYGENHENDKAIICFEAMQVHGIKPDALAFTCVLAVCSHGNLVIKGQEYFMMIHQELKLPLTMNHFACMVDLFARSGKVCEAEKFASAMHCPPSGLILRALLSSCKIYGKVEPGEQCFGQLTEKDEELASGCLLMEEIYGSALGGMMQILWREQENM